MYAKNTNLIKICHVHNLLILFIFQEAKLGRPPTPFEVFKRIHEKKDGSFVDKRSNDINVSFSIFIFNMYVSVSMLIAFRIY